MDLPRLHCQPAPACVRNADAHAGVFHGAGQSHVSGVVKIRLYRLQRFHQSGFRTNDLAVRQGLAGTDGVAVADLPGGDAHQFRHLIEHGFQAEAGLGHAEAPEGSGRGIVGVVSVAVDLEGFVVVGARRVGAGPLQHRPAQGGIGPRIGDDVGGHSLDDAVLVAPHGELHLHRVPLGVNQEALRPGELAFHGPSGEISRQGGMVLDGDILLPAETAAHQQIFYLHLLWRKAQHGGGLVLGVVGSLVSREDHHPVPIGIGHGALRLQKGVLGVGSVELPGENVFTFGDGKGGVAPLDMLVGHQIAAFVDQGSVGQHGFSGGADGLEDLIVHLHQLFGLLQNFRSLGGHEADGVPQIVGHASYSNHGVPVLHQMTHLVLPGNVGGGEYPAGEGFGFLCADGLDDGPGMGGADGRGVKHAFHVHIVGINAGALDLFRHINAVDPAAQCPRTFFLRNVALPEKLRRQTYTLYDLHIPGAPADVGFQGGFDLVCGGIRVMIQQALGGHDHAGNAEAALDRSRLAEAVGVGFLFKVAEALYGDDGFSIHFIGGKDAGPDGLPVHQYGAGSAGPLAASVLHAGQAQLIPEEADQLLILLGGDGFAVYGECRHVWFSLQRFSSILSTMKRVERLIQ